MQTILIVEDDVLLNQALRDMLPHKCGTALLYTSRSFFQT